jgi:hypothetical protein
VTADDRDAAGCCTTPVARNLEGRLGSAHAKGPVSELTGPSS